MVDIWMCGVESHCSRISAVPCFLLLNIHFALRPFPSSVEQVLISAMWGYDFMQSRFDHFLAVTWFMIVSVLDGLDFYLFANHFHYLPIADNLCFQRCIHNILQVM